MIRLLVLDKVFWCSRSLQSLFQARQTVVFQALQFVLCTVATSLCSYSRGSSHAALVWCFVFRPGQQSEMEVDLPPPLRQFPSVLDTGKMIAVQYAREPRFFHQRLILWTASVAQHHTCHTCDSTNGLLWILTQDGDVYRELFHVAPATGVSVAQREGRSYFDDDDARWSPPGAGLLLRSAQAYSTVAESHRVRRYSKLKRRWDTCRERAAATAAPESGFFQGCLKWIVPPRHCRAPPDTTPRRRCQRRGFSGLSETMWPILCWTHGS